MRVYLCRAEVNNIVEDGGGLLEVVVSRYPKTETGHERISHMYYIGGFMRKHVDTYAKMFYSTLT